MEQLTEPVEEQNAGEVPSLAFTGLPRQDEGNRPFPYCGLKNWGQV